MRAIIIFGCKIRLIGRHQRHLTRISQLHQRVFDIRRSAIGITLQFNVETVGKHALQCRKNLFGRPCAPGTQMLVERPFGATSEADEPGAVRAKQLGINAHRTMSAVFQMGGAHQRHEILIAGLVFHQ